ncbi:hypothetical protein DPMN_041678 [Dreissena polymorpha]|uniref:Uncharacterized protein n=1 Tax=Dreissena polymorpha TaxID=45954 RepID=A0A9D4CZS1_DREPO|nr:hypothetical protein DPMN_041678 [Dreissena polymorpha]
MRGEIASPAGTGLAHTRSDHVVAVKKRFTDSESRAKLVKASRKIVWPVRDSNPGHLANRASALPTELTGQPHNLSPNVTKCRQ